MAENNNSRPHGPGGPGGPHGGPRGGFGKPKDLRKTALRTLKYIVDRPVLLAAVLACVVAEALLGVRATYLQKPIFDSLTLALASSKAENQCVPICERFGFAPYLTVISGSSDQRDQSKAEVIRQAMARLGLEDPRRGLMVGDRKCGMDCAGVEFFGYAPPGELESAGAVAVVRTVAELEAFILQRGR